MANSFGPAQAATPIESVPVTLDHALSARRYEITRENGAIVQRRTSTPTGDAYALAATHVIGSGKNARSYLHRAANGEFIQLPLSWYQQEKRWAMSPGYDAPHHYDFSRAVEPGCLACHQSIGCERCHANHTNKSAAVCLDCHLPAGSDLSAHSVNSHGYRMLASPCSKKSSGRLQCTTCHDPHGDTNVVQRTRSACLDCHQSHGKPECETCHMPRRAAEDATHVQITDHGIGAVEMPVPRALPKPAARIPPHLKTGNDFLRAGRPDLAIPHWKKAAASVRTRSEALNNLGAAYLDQGQRALAEKALSEAVSFDPDSAEAQNNYARVLAAQGRLPEAISRIRRAIALDPGYAAAQYNLGRLLHAAGQVSEAMGAYQKAIELEPNNPAAHLSLGVALAETGRMEEAAREFRLVLKLQPGNADAARNLRLIGRSR